MLNIIYVNLWKIGGYSKERAVFILIDCEGLSVKEAAGVLGASSMSIRTHLSRARQKLRGRLEKIFPDEPLENE